MAIRQREHLGGVPVQARRGPARSVSLKQDPFASGQNLRAREGALSEAPFQDRLRRTSASGKPLQPVERGGRDDAAVFTPTSTEILCSLLKPVENATHCPSGEKDGYRAPSVPGTSVAFG